MDKMNNRGNVPAVKENKEYTVFSKNSYIADILELCIDSKTKIEFENTLKNFFHKLETCVSEDVDFCEFDAVCMYAISCVYKNNTESLCVVLRSIYAYHQQIQLTLSDCDTNSWIICNQDGFLRDLRQITDLHTYPKCEEMLVDMGLASILDGNMVLARLLVKYGFLEFPFELSEKCKRMTKILVDGFNCSFEHAFKLRPALNTRTIIQYEELLNLMKYREISFRRFLLTFCTIVIVSEYSTYDVEEMDDGTNTFNQSKINICTIKFMCLNVFFDATTETGITCKDIEIFIANYIDPLLHADVGKYLVKGSREMLSDYYNPRSLKDLTRCKIRENLRNSMTFPEQINQLPIPEALKYFLFFQGDKTWDFLKLSHLIYDLEQKTKSRALLMRSIFAALRN